MIFLSIYSFHLQRRTSHLTKRRYQAKMMFLGVLCLAACALAQPTVYVSRSSLTFPESFYYPLDASLRKVAIATDKDETAKEVIISAVPEAPELAPLAMIEPIMLDAKSIKDEKEVMDEKIDEELELEPKADEETKEDEELKLEEELKIEEEPKEEKLLEEGLKRPIMVRLKPPQFVTDFISALPQFTFPFDWGSIFAKPPVVGTVHTPIEPVRYRVAYAYPPIMSKPIVEIAKK